MEFLLKFSFTNDGPMNETGLPIEILLWNRQNIYPTSHPLYVTNISGFSTHIVEL